MSGSTSTRNGVRRPTQPETDAPQRPARSKGAAPGTPHWLPVLVLFAFDGFVFGTWASRVPDLSAQVQASPAGLGAALLCISLGALAAMQLAGRWCTRYGGGAVATASAGLLSIALVLPGFASTVTHLAAALVLFGAATGAVNVSANSLGVRLEGLHGRSLLPMLHAGVSFGALSGAVLGGVISTAAGVLPHLLAVAALGVLVTVGGAKGLARIDPFVPAEVRRPGEPRTRQSARPAPAERVRNRGIVVMLGAVAGCTAFAEGTLTDWAALHLKTDLGAGSVAAAAGFAGFSLAMGVGRLLGGRAIRRFGETRLLVGGALVAATAMVPAAFSSSVPVVLTSFLLVGAGLANVFPVAIASAGAVAGPGGVALASTVGYAGLLGGPPLIGFVADHFGLPIALTLVAALALGVAALARTVRSLADRRAITVFPVEEGAPATAAARTAAVSGAVSQLLHGYFADLSLLSQSR